MNIITSGQNPLIKKITQLHIKKGRKKYNQFIAEGFRTCSTILESGLVPKYCFATQETFDESSQLFKTNVLLVSQDVMKKISTSKTPSNILAVFSIPTKKDTKILGPGIVLASMRDPGNVGTLIRTAVALAKPTVIIIDGVDPWSPKVVQSTAGTIALANIFQLSWKELIKGKKNLILVALVVSEGENPQNLDLTRALLIIGGEAHGIPHEWLKDCDELITLPMPGGTESLNAAVAGSIALYKSINQ